MKIQKVIMGSLVLVFAVGSAVASTYLTSPVYVRAVTNDSSNDCVALDVTCNDETQNPCRVIVDTEEQGLQTAPARNIEGAVCTTQLFNSSSTPIPASPVDPSKTIFELLEAE